jgi:hypothetical protein
MGVVYLAREVRLDRAVAIKLLPPELAVQASLRDRFLREARTAARLSHPYIVPIHAVDEVDSFVFYVMAYVDGETLAERVAARGPLQPADAARTLREVAWALAYAHAQGIVHRDVKPGNILLERGTERAMVVDFGIARATQGGGETAVGELLGTPEYMSPEQASGEAVDGRSDLYALGAVGFFAVTGAPPFTAPTTQAVLAQQITRAAPPVTSVARGVTASLARAIDSCLEKDPAARPRTGEALADALIPTLDRRAEIPVPIRVFLDRRRNSILIAPVAMLLPMSMGLIASPGPVTLARVGGLVGLGAAALAIPLVVVLARLRALLKAGYGPDDIAAGLRATFERQQEEFQYTFGITPSVRERVFRVAGIAGLAIGAVGAIALAAGAPERIAAPVTVISLYVGIGTTAIGGKWRRLRRGAGSRWSSFWQGRVGRALANLAGFKLTNRAVPANRPTELGIAMSAESLYSGLTKVVRESLGDVPAVLRALEAHARAARTRIVEVDATLAEALRRPGHAAPTDRQAKLVADLTTERASAEERLAEVVTTLENVRIDLLRLQAGTTSLDGITQDLGAARALGEGADRLLAGVREAEEATKPGR